MKDSLILTLKNAKFNSVAVSIVRRFLNKNCFISEILEKCKKFLFGIARWKKLCTKIPILLGNNVA